MAPLEIETIVRRGELGYACRTGEGLIDFHGFVRQLKMAGFDGALSLEARAIDATGRVEVDRIQTSLQFIRRPLAEGDRPDATRARQS